MSKVYVQKVVTVTLELTEKEAMGLRCLLKHGVGNNTSTLSSLGLTDVSNSLYIKEIEELKVEFESVAVVKK